MVYNVGMEIEIPNTGLITKITINGVEFDAAPDTVVRHGDELTVSAITDEQGSVVGASVSVVTPDSILDADTLEEGSGSV